MLEKDNLADYYQRVGQLIKSKREGAKKSQEQLSKYLGFESRISIANIERGKQKIHVHTLVKIASYLKIKPDDLLPQLEMKTNEQINPEFAKNLNKEGINRSASTSVQQMLTNLPYKKILK